MQYIFTEDEFNNLHRQIDEAIAENSSTINKLCEMVADHMPITEWPGTKENPRPWGCCKTTDEEWYCDNCPVQKVCRHPKEWSK